MILGFGVVVRWIRTLFGCVHETLAFIYYLFICFTSLKSSPETKEDTGQCLVHHSKSSVTHSKVLVFWEGNGTWRPEDPHEIPYGVLGWHLLVTQNGERDPRVGRIYRRLPHVSRRRTTVSLTKPRVGQSEWESGGNRILFYSIGITLLSCCEPIILH